jgi:hypothetical protein
LKITKRICTAKNTSKACKITVIDPQTMPESAKIASVNRIKAIWDPKFPVTKNHLFPEVLLD